jgi:hypothetical protein
MPLAISLLALSSQASASLFVRAGLDVPPTCLIEVVDDPGRLPIKVAQVR